MPALSRRNAQGTIIGKGYYNTICDKRVDSYETSTRCLSYGYDKQTINSARPGGTIRENKPLLPEMSPLTAYKDLFGGFAPGATITDRDALRLLKLRKSVLDYSLRELDRLKTLGPASEREKIDGHAAAVRKLEAQLSEQIAGGGAIGACASPPMPDAALTGQGRRVAARRLRARSTVNTSDETTHEAVGKAHAAILRAAFACDLIRVATFQWSPGTNHVAFKGVDPNAPDTIWMHHPLSHQVTDAAFFNGPRPAERHLRLGCDGQRQPLVLPEDGGHHQRAPIAGRSPGPDGREPARPHGDPDDHGGGRGLPHPRRARRDHLRRPEAGNAGRPVPERLRHPQPAVGDGGAGVPRRGRGRQARERGVREDRGEPDRRALAEILRFLPLPLAGEGRGEGRLRGARANGCSWSERSP